MIQKERAIAILEDIQDSLMSDDWKEKTLQNINLYIKGLDIVTDKKIEKMVNKHCEYTKIYGENGRKTIRLGKKLDREVQEIYNRKFL